MAERTGWCEWHCFDHTFHTWSLQLSAWWSDCTELSVCWRWCNSFSLKLLSCVPALHVLIHDYRSVSSWWTLSIVSITWAASVSSSSNHVLVFGTNHFRRSLKDGISNHSPQSIDRLTAKQWTDRHIVPAGCNSHH